MRFSMTVIVSTIVGLSACAEKSKFNSGTSSGASSSSTPSSSSSADQSLPGSSADGADAGKAQAPGTVSSTPGLTSCSEGDKVVVPWKGVVKDCFDQGKTFNFDTQSCVDIRKATFACDWSTVQGKLQEKGLLTETMKNDAAGGAKLVNCSESSDGNRIAVQWVKVSLSPQVSCQNIQEGAGITTGCYTYYPNSTPPPPPASAEELRQRVGACLKEI